ncbi:hypothetical protein [Neisseria iguanae]|uniref:Uncharacterized protein n=1 Tax=Neisseria iguanae TaxID=90242 RepID=A0A2P7U381_9NEIS|nr:hypothetical protein C7N83_00450 [Neisseria iguanae]
MSEQIKNRILAENRYEKPSEHINPCSGGFSFSLNQQSLFVRRQLIRQTAVGTIFLYDFFPSTEFFIWGESFDGRYVGIARAQLGVWRPILVSVCATGISDILWFNHIVLADLQCQA